MRINHHHNKGAHHVWCAETMDQVTFSRDRRSVPDDAWNLDDHKTNNRLADGDAVELVSRTRGETNRGYIAVPAGTRGIVIHAKTVRVRGPGYFANVDCMVDGVDDLVRIRVPHNALRKFMPSITRRNGSASSSANDSVATEQVSKT